MIPAASPPSTPWHEGELLAQRLGGAPEALSKTGGRHIRPVIDGPEAAFLSVAPLLVVGGADAAGRLWAGVTVGPTGFMVSPTPEVVVVRTPADAPTPLPAAGAAIGLLVMEPLTRQRLRVNGRLMARDDDGFQVAVDQCYANCRAHIAVRRVSPPDAGTRWSMDERPELDAAALDLISGADTAFVVSHAPGVAKGGVDVSHRGGRAGFITIDADGWLVVPDVPGNNYFNTLGNFLTDPRGGLTVTDFATGAVLAVSGSVEVVWEHPTRGRHWRLKPEATRRWSVLTP